MSASPIEPKAQRRYPAVVEGELAEPLSRWLWLVKWLLAIPHFIVLNLAPNEPEIPEGARDD